MTRATQGLSAERESSTLDFLRAVAVLFVVFSHLLPGLGYTDSFVGRWPFHWQGLGILGVVMFFVHTCLVLMMSLQRQRERSGTRNLHKIFLARRFFRIYPLSIAVVCASYALASIHFAPETVFSWKGFLANLALVQNITNTNSVPEALWTLPREVQMYLLLPGLFLLVWPDRARGRRMIVALWFLSAAVVFSIAYAHVEDRFVQFLPSFLPGVLAFALMDRPPRRPFWLLLPMLVVFAIFFPVLTKLTGMPVFLSWPVCCSLGLLLPHLREVPWRAVRQGAKVVAKYSYGIYLTHGWAVWFATSRLSTWNLAARLLVFFSIAAALAWLAFHVIEKPGIRLGHKLVERLWGDDAPEPFPTRELPTNAV